MACQLFFVFDFGLLFVSWVDNGKNDPQIYFRINRRLLIPKQIFDKHDIQKTSETIIVRKTGNDRGKRVKNQIEA